MIRKFALGLSLIAIAFGVWMLTDGYAQESACNSYNSEFGHGAAAMTCARAIPSFLVGVVLTLAGVALAVVLLFGIAKQMRERNWRERMPLLARRNDHSVSSVAR